VRAPARETTVERENEGSESRGWELRRRKGKSKIGLGKGGEGTTEDGSHPSGFLRWNVHRNEAGFVEVDSEAGRRGKIVQDFPKASSRFLGGPAKDQGIICVLEDGAREVRGEGVSEGAVLPGLKDKALEEVSNYDKKVRGERVPLSETIATTDPTARHPIEEDSSMPRGED
jgi:hypothetical protein